MIRVEGRNISDPNFGGSNVRNLDTGRFSSEIADKLAKSLRSSMEQVSSRNFQTTRVSAATANFSKGLGENTLELQKLISNQTEEFTKNFNELIDSFKKSDPTTVLKSIEKTLKTLDEDTAKQLEEKLNLKEIRKGLVGGATIREKFNKFMGADSDKGPIEGIKQVFAEPERLFGAKRGFLGTGAFSGGEDGIKRASERLLDSDNLKSQAKNLSDLSLNETSTKEKGKKGSTFSSGIDRNDSSKGIMDELKKQTKLLEEISGKPAGGGGGGGITDLASNALDAADLLDGPDKNKTNPDKNKTNTKKPRRSRSRLGRVLNSGKNLGSKGLNAGKNLVSKIPTKALLKGGLRAAGNAAKFIPGVGLAIGAGMAAFDGIGGWNADENASLGSKFKNAGSSILNGLSFGLLGSSPEEIAARAAEAEATPEMTPTPEPTPAPTPEPTPAPTQTIPKETSDFLEEVKSNEPPTEQATVNGTAQRVKPNYDALDRLRGNTFEVSALQKERDSLVSEKNQITQTMLEAGTSVPADSRHPDYPFAEIDKRLSEIRSELKTLEENKEDEFDPLESPVRTRRNDRLSRTSLRDRIRNGNTEGVTVSSSSSSSVTGGETTTGGGATVTTSGTQSFIDTEESNSLNAEADKLQAEFDKKSNGDVGYLFTDEGMAEAQQIDALRKQANKARIETRTPSTTSRIEGNVLPTSEAVGNATDAVSSSNQQMPPIINNITNNNVASGGSNGGGITVMPAGLRDTRSSVQRLQDRASQF